MTKRWRYPGRQPIPPRTRVWVRSVSGIECEAVISRYGMRRVWTRDGIDRVHCWRLDTKSGSGDLMVMAWKPIEAARGKQ